MRELSRSQPVTLIPIDTTSFSRQCEQRQSQRSLSAEYVPDVGTGSMRRSKRHRRQRPKTVAGLPLEGSIVRPADTSHLRSLSRERWERPHSMIDAYHAPRQSRRSAERRRDIYDNDPEESNLARSCSLRRSLKSLFKGSRSKSGDLWVEGRPVSPGPPIVDLTSNYPTVKRSRSLPRTLKSAFHRSMTRLTSRSASTEGRLDSCNDESDDASEQQDLSPNEHIAHVVHHRPPPHKGKFNRMVRSKSHHGCSTFTESETVEPRRRNGSVELLATPGGSSTRGLSAVPVSTPSMPSTSASSLPMPQPVWYTDVKLRDSKSTLREGDDRHSSSGKFSLFMYYCFKHILFMSKRIGRGLKCKRPALEGLFTKESTHTHSHTVCTIYYL